MKLEASALYRQKMLIANGTLSATYPDISSQSEKLSFVRFLQQYQPYIEDLPFLCFFTVTDIVALKLLCRDTARIFNEDLMFDVIRIGNLDPSIRIYFWVMQAPFYE